MTPRGIMPVGRQEPVVKGEICSNCERDMYTSWYCAVCHHELLCGSVSEPCPHEGCRERRVPTELAGSKLPMYDARIFPVDRLIRPKWEASKDGENR